jgi:hypothetical protein
VLTAVARHSSNALADSRHALVDMRSPEDAQQASMADNSTPQGDACVKLRGLTWASIY